jgi:hypothetical protein
MNYLESLITLLWVDNLEDIRSILICRPIAWLPLKMLLLLIEELICIVIIKVFIALLAVVLGVNSVELLLFFLSVER